MIPLSPWEISRFLARPEGILEEGILERAGGWGEGVSSSDGNTPDDGRRLTVPVMVDGESQSRELEDTWGSMEETMPLRRWCLEVMSGRHCGVD